MHSLASAMFSALLVLVLVVLPMCLSANELSEPYLLFSTWSSVSRMNLDGSNYTVLVDSSSNVGILAVDYHWRQNTMFWGNYVEDTINRANLDGSNQEIVVPDVNRPSGLAVDWVNCNVYFSFGDPGSNEVNPNHLAIYNMTTGQHTEIIPATPFKIYYELALDPIGEKLYWTAGSRILQSTLSGENVEILLTTGNCANALTLCNSYLFFTNGCPLPHNYSVNSLNLTTREVSVIVDGSDGSDGVAVYEDTVYWTGSRRVYSTPVDGNGLKDELLYISHLSFRGIAVVHPTLQNVNMSCPSVNKQPNPTHTSLPTTDTTSPSAESSSPSILIPVLVSVAIVMLIVILLAIGCCTIYQYKKHSNGRSSPQKGTIPNVAEDRHNTSYSSLQNDQSEQRSLVSCIPSGITTENEYSTEASTPALLVTTVQEKKPELEQVQCSSLQTTISCMTTPNTSSSVLQPGPLNREAQITEASIPGSELHKPPTPTEGKLTDNNIPFSGKKKPTLPMLLKVGVPQKVGANYKKFGIILLNDDDGSLVDAIEVDNQGSENRVTKILSKWLREERKPVTWKQLINTLQECGLYSPAKDIQNQLYKLDIT